mgnify:FL=1
MLTKEYQRNDYSENYDVEYHRGDVVWVDFGDTVGSEQGGIRPAVVIQNEKGNQHSPCLIVAIMTSRDKKPMITHVSVNPSIETGLKKPTITMMEQVRTIDKSRILGWSGRLGEGIMESIDKAIAVSFGLVNLYYSA